jgi:hypothetical protein
MSTGLTDQAIQILVGRRWRAILRSPLCQARGRKRGFPDEPTSAKEQVSPMAENNFTTVGGGPSTEHRWTRETGRVQPEHPFSPEMVRD